MSDAQEAGRGAEASSGTALLIIRAWIEEGSSDPLRAEVRVIPDVVTGTGLKRTFAGAEQVMASVEEWLADIVAAALPA